MSSNFPAVSESYKSREHEQKDVRVPLSIQLTFHRSLTMPDDFEQIRQALIDHPDCMYLGTTRDDIKGELTWLRDRNREYVVSTQDAEEYQRALDAFNSQPKNNPRPELPNAKLFSVVVRLSANKFFLHATAHWSLKQAWPKNFSELKLSAVGEPADVDVFKNDYGVMLDNLWAIINTGRVPGRTSVNGVYDPEVKGVPKDGPRPNNHMRFRHALFDVSHIVLNTHHTVTHLKFATNRNYRAG